MRLDPTAVRQQIENLKLLFPELADDEESWTLTIESETEFLVVMEKVANVMREAASMAGGIAGRIAELELRQGRFTRREQAMRILAFKLMQWADQKKVELPEVTMSIRKGTPKVIITDEAAIPFDYMRITKSPNKDLIGGFLKDGKTIPGTELSNAEPTLSVRTK